MFARIRRNLLVLGAAGALAAVPTVAAAAGVSPSTVDDALDPGASTTVTKTITTPEIPPKPDIVLLADTTGSMGGALTDVKSGMNALVTAVQAEQPDAQFAVASYRDVGDGAELFRVRTGLTGDLTTLQTAVNGLFAGGGGDNPEAQLNALYRVGSGGDAISFRPDSTRIVVWFGDQPGHDPSNGVTEAMATGSLTDVAAQVIAISVGFNQLDASGQATRISAATGGTFYSGIDVTRLTETILAALRNLPAQVTATTVCDDGLSVSFDPALPQTVTSGEDLVLSETIAVAADAEQGATLTCTTTFLVNGEEQGSDFVQTVTIRVNDVTAPVVACGAGVNPAGNTPAGFRHAGFYLLTATDNVTATGDLELYVRDSVPSAQFGPYASGTTIKLTQAPSATPSAVPGSGAVDWKIVLRGDAVVVAVDAAGNESAPVMCTVPPRK